MSVDHYENFPVASVLCPPPLRPAVRAIYHFARVADDIADEGDSSPTERLRLLHEYRAALVAALQGEIGNAWPEVFGPLAREVKRHDLPVHLLHALLSAFEQDVHNPRYADREQVLDYCSRSANPVGRLLLHLYGLADARSLARSDAICTALQLANFWQDLSVDLARGRCYLPQADALRHGLHDIDPRRVASAPGAIPLVHELVAWARELMLQGAPLVRSIPGRAGWELRLVVQGGLRILDKTERIDPFRHRPSLGPADAPLLLWRALRMSAR